MLRIVIISMRYTAPVTIPPKSGVATFDFFYHDRRRYRLRCTYSTHDLQSYSFENVRSLYYARWCASSCYDDNDYIYYVDDDDVVNYDMLYDATRYMRLDVDIYVIHKQHTCTNSLSLLAWLLLYPCHWLRIVRASLIRRCIAINLQPTSRGEDLLYTRQFIWLCASTHEIELSRSFYVYRPSQLTHF